MVNHPNNRISSVGSYCLLILMLFLVIACQEVVNKNPISKVKTSSAIGPIVLDQKEITIQLEDLENYLGKIDSLKTPMGIQYKWSEDRKQLKLVKKAKTPPMLSDIKCYVNGQPLSVVLHLPYPKLDSTKLLKPTLSFVRQDYKQVILAIENSGKYIVPMWENIRIGYHKRRDVEEVFIRIPEQALEMEKTKIEVWCSNVAGLSDVLEIPIEKGKVVYD